MKTLQEVKFVARSSSEMEQIVLNNKDCKSEVNLIVTTIDAVNQGNWSLSIE